MHAAKIIPAGTIFTITGHHNGEFATFGIYRALKGICLEDLNVSHYSSDTHREIIRTLVENNSIHMLSSFELFLGKNQWELDPELRP